MHDQYDREAEKAAMFRRADLHAEAKREQEERLAMLEANGVEHEPVEHEITCQEIADEYLEQIDAAADDYLALFEATVANVVDDVPNEYTEEQAEDILAAAGVSHDLFAEQIGQRIEDEGHHELAMIFASQRRAAAAQQGLCDANQ